jgi:O-acetyl-ADP-ribose deacetylase (regulator of RNase III)
MLKHVKGDLLNLAAQGEFTIIMHGCNCHNTMGSGIARQVRERYPEAYAVDCMTNKGDKSKLGTISCVQVDNSVGGQLLIVNAYTQYNFNSGGTLVDVFEYEAFDRILDAFAHDAGPSMRIGLPYIGMGLAGGDKVRIMGMIEDFAQKVSAKGGTVTLVEFG